MGNDVSTNWQFFVSMPFFIAGSVVLLASSTALLNASRSVFEYEKSAADESRWIFRDQSPNGDKLRSLISNYFMAKAFIYIIAFLYFFVCILRFYNGGEYIIKLEDNKNNFFTRKFGEFADYWASIETLYFFTFLFFSAIILISMILIYIITRHVSKRNINIV